jgi:hypothetical protein
MKRDEGNHRGAFETKLLVMSKESLPEENVAQGAVQADEGGDIAFAGNHMPVLLD